MSADTTDTLLSAAPPVDVAAQAPAPAGDPYGQRRLAAMIEHLRQWQREQDAEGRNRHGRCLESVRAAVTASGLHIPAPMPAPRNLAIANFHVLTEDPAAFDWRPANPSLHRYTLDYFGGVGRLPDGRIAGHIAVTDHLARVLFSSTDYPEDQWWVGKRVGSFVPVV